MACRTSHGGVPFVTERKGILQDEKHKVKNPSLDRARRIVEILKGKQ